MKAEIKEFLKYKETITKKLKKYVKDKKIPLKERWELFIDSDFGEHESFYVDFKNCTIDDYCDIFERHETINIERLLNLEFMENLSEKELNEFKEDVLKSFVKSFTYDW